MKLISLFSGIGGFELAAEWMGWQPVVSCEINPFGKKVLQHYWPKAYHHDDIKTLTYEKINKELTQRFGPCWRSNDIILTGGFPCQPYSMAGKRLGKEDDRHLWPEMLRVIREIQPRWVVGENVLGLVNWNGGLVFDEVQTDLEAQGYEVQPYVLPACAVNAPHRRDRIWFVAYRNSARFQTPRAEQQATRIEQYGKLGRNASDTNGNPTRTSGEGASIEGIGGSNDVQQSERGSKTELNNRPSSVPRDVTHPHRNGLNWSDCQHEIQPSEGGEYAQRDFEQMGGDAADTDGKRSGSKHEFCSGRNVPEEWIDASGFTPHPNSRRQSSEEYGQEESGRITEKSLPGNWQNFPTQSPICTGDDGLSSRLDNITFSKWRNESIKAAGNAIVPQVALQIFKAIQAYEK